jgi:putative ABC transport system ATP-binding protein
MMIEIDGATKSYDTPAGPFPALRAVDLAVAPGEAIALVGKSGSGKSTLLNLIGGIDSPSGGEIRVAGVSVGALGGNALARWRGKTVGFVLTAAENVMLPMDFRNATPPRERRPKALALLDRVGVAARADRLPSALSGGEQQRVAIARALANDPPVVLADEPTGNLDSATAREVLALFRRLADAGTTVVVATHERDLAEFADRVVTVADGVVSGPR